ncbi:MAG TPA: hypothetical protein VFK05_15070 [Polyangiaceae bacterium]|nr:hypothetical protein [Polyangiaceae bacterium]
MRSARWVTGLAVLAVACGSSSSDSGDSTPNGGAAGASGFDGSFSGANNAGASNSTGGAGARSGSGGANEPGGDAGSGEAAGSGADAGATDGIAGSNSGGSNATGGTDGQAGAEASGNGGVAGGGVAGGSGGVAGGGVAGGGGGTGGTGTSGSAGIAGGGAPLGGAGGALANGGAGGGNGCAEGSTGPNCSVCVVYVNKSGGNDTNDGRTWATAKSNVQNGIDAAFANSSPCQVWVAQGSYVPTYMADPFASAKTATLLLRAGIALYGGFAGNEYSLEARNIAAHVTTLTGAITIGTKPDSLYHVVTAAGGGTIDGFTITGSGESAVQCSGGTLTLAHDTFTANHGLQGGALKVAAATVLISNSAFTSNTGAATGSLTTEGGAIYNDSTGTVTIQSSTFSKNSADQGGAIFSPGAIEVRDTVFEDNSAAVGGGALIAGEPTLEGCTFNANRAPNASAIYSGGTITLRSSTISNNTVPTADPSLDVIGAVNVKNITVESSNFVGNTALAKNGGTTAAGGGLYATGTVKIKNSSFRNNLVSAGTSSSGAGFLCDSGCAAQLVAVTFDGNVAKPISGTSYGMGGALYFRGISLALDDCQFTNNQAKAYGGAIRTAVNPSAVTIRSSTFYGNSAATGGAVYLSNGPASFLNSIFWGNTATVQGSQVFNAGSVASTVRACNVQDSGFTGASGNIDQNPLFVSTTAGALDLRLQSGSPCVNSGANADLGLDALDLDSDGNLSESLPLDLLGKARVQGTALDMGAYESGY